MPIDSRKLKIYCNRHGLSDNQVAAALRSAFDDMRDKSYAEILHTIRAYIRRLYRTDRNSDDGMLLYIAICAFEQLYIYELLGADKIFELNAIEDYITNGRFSDTRIDGQKDAIRRVVGHVSAAFSRRFGSGYTVDIVAVSYSERGNFYTVRYAEHYAATT